MTSVRKIRKDSGRQVTAGPVLEDVKTTGKLTQNTACSRKLTFARRFEKGVVELDGICYNGLSIFNLCPYIDDREGLAAVPLEPVKDCGGIPVTSCVLMYEGGVLYPCTLIAQFPGALQEEIESALANVRQTMRVAGGSGGEDLYFFGDGCCIGLSKNCITFHWGI